MPSPAEIDVEECAAPNGSYSLSARRVKPDRPPAWRSVRMRSRRPGQDLVRISLMSDIPDYAVARRLEHRMDCDRQLDYAERGPEMPAGEGDRVDRLGTQLSTQAASTVPSRSCANQMVGVPGRGVESRIAQTWAFPVRDCYFK